MCVESVYASNNIYGNRVFSKYMEDLYEKESGVLKKPAGNPRSYKIESLFLRGAMMVWFNRINNKYHGAFEGEQKTSK